MRESLFAQPSFLSGVARIFDFWAVFDSYNASQDEERADGRAIGSDWRAVGGDLRAAIREYGESQLEDAEANLLRTSAVTSSGEDDNGVKKSRISQNKS